MPSARQESLRFVLPLLLVAALLAGTVWEWPAGRIASIPLLALELGLTLFVLYFFRDPERAVPADAEIIVSAADGLVVSVEEMDEPDFHSAGGCASPSSSPSSMSTSTARPSRAG